MFIELEKVQFPLADRFYKENNHKGKTRSNERVFAVKQAHTFKAALRACGKANGYLLRSVWVEQNSRGDGIGHQLMLSTLDVLSPAPCWCYPYDHLEYFYRKAGFRITSSDNVPDEIATPFLRYQQQGQKLLLMTINQSG